MSLSRRRYLSTAISLDRRVNLLATKHGDFAALLYTWMIPHADDAGRLSGDPLEILCTVCPMRRDKTEEDVARALEGMVDAGLICWQPGQLVRFPQSFFKHQSYITEKRREAAAARTGGSGSGGPEEAAEESETEEEESPAQITEEKRTSAQSSAHQRTLPQNAAMYTVTGIRYKDTVTGNGQLPPLPPPPQNGFFGKRMPSGETLEEYCARIESQHPHWKTYVERQAKTKAQCPPPYTPYKASIYQQAEAGTITILDIAPGEAAVAAAAAQASGRLPDVEVPADFNPYGNKSATGNGGLAA